MRFHCPARRWLLAVSHTSRVSEAQYKILTIDSMLAVMTLNVGYFLSVLAGLFLGELAVGRFTGHGDGDHH